MTKTLALVDQFSRPIRMEAAGPNFHGASYSRRLGTWGTSTAGPDSAQVNSLATLRARSRELVRNSAEISGAVDTLAANLVGQGITPRWQLSDPATKAALQTAWADWTQQSDFDGIADFAGLQTLAARCLIESGEVLVRFRYLLPGTQPVPLQIQAIEPDHLDESYTGIAPNGNAIRMGIEFNAAGQRVAYWLFVEHPGEYFLTTNTVDRVRVPASEILHVYRPLRPGQKRGRPWLSSVIATLHEMEKYIDAEQMRKTGAAMFGGFITAPPGESEQIPSIMGQDADETDPQILALEPGSFPTLPPGFDVKFSDPAEVGNSYEPFVRHQERRIARGLGMTHAQYSGDLSQVNFSSIRAGNVEFQRLAKQIIANVLAFQLCQQVAKKWLDTAVLAGAVRLPDYTRDRAKYDRIQWNGDGWQYVNPVQDVNADKIAIRAGLKSRAEVINERGRDIEQVDRENAEDKQRAATGGLVFDSDPANDKGTK